MVFHRDYTLSMYRRLIRALAPRYECLGIAAFCAAREAGRLPERFAVIRHDVDANLPNALRMARVDADQGISSTFYFRIKPFVFKRETIQLIAELGHEVGYHYEVMSDEKGNPDKARRLFAENLSRLRQIAPVRTACMHGRPFSPYNNLDFWKFNELAEFDLMAEPYLSIDYANIYYLSDSGMTWDNQELRVRDKVAGLEKSFHSTADILHWLERDEPERLAFLLHTDSWVDNPFTWLYYTSHNRLANLVKTMRRYLRA